jgi:[ribosomal protein S5]-alanine N-acetyltransferase
VPELTRLVRPTDAAELAELYSANSEHLAPWDPARPDWFFTPEGQADVLATQLANHALGMAEPRVIVSDGRIVGRVNLSNIAYGPFRSAILGYWVDRFCAGRGVASRAVAEMVGVAFGGLGLHRLEAGTLPHNFASQAVLTRNGFERFGYAPRYLEIAGRFQDHILFQRLNE